MAAPPRPPHSAYRDAATGDNAPIELQLDLLVDGELPEDQRHTVLLAMERHATWRELALRFLQRQTEQETVRLLMTGGRVVPVDLAPATARRPAIIGRIGWIPAMATAAGLLIAAISALVTLYVVRPVPATALVEFQTSLPRDMVSSDAAVPVSVPMVRTVDNAMLFPVSNEGDDAMTRKSVIIQPNGRGGFIMIPVSTSKTKVF